MNVAELKSSLRARPELNVRIVLPDGSPVPAHYHVTEVGHVARRFLDCGGTTRRHETCLLQTFLASPRDDGHRLTAGKLAHILDLAAALLASDDLPVEVEYEGEFISQFPLAGVTCEDGSLVLHLGLKHTDCLARDRCGVRDANDVAEPAGQGCAGAAAGGGCC